MAALESFKGFSPGSMSAPYTKAVVAALSDTVDLTVITRALYIGVGGALKVNLADGSTVVFPAVIAGVFPIRVARVWSAGTTATGIVALW